MKKILLLSVLLSVSTVLSAQDENPAYNPELATQLGADDYGMKWYVLVILKTGTNTTLEKPVLDSLFAGHMQTIRQLSDQGKLIVAGPIARNANAYRGIFILDAATLEEANQLLLNDPTIRENVLSADLYRWYGSAALPVYIETHEKIGKVKIE